VAPERPAAFTVAWFEMVPSDVASTVTRNATALEADFAIVPPAVALAPAPRRTLIVRVAETYSPWSSPAASVFVPTLSPAVTRSEPGTKVRPAGRTSVSTTPVPVSKPTLVVVIVYSSVSPARTAPPACALRSVTVFVVAEKSGFVVAMDVTKPPSR
jgi:hypothetical protein